MRLLILLIIGIWLGMVLGISFLEAPLKFKAPNITLTLGLGIGKLVFSALNKIEIAFSIVLICWMTFQYKSLGSLEIAMLTLLIVLVVIQSVWLMPILNERVDRLIEGVEVAKSNHHFYYVGIEIIKVVVLIFSFIKIYPNE